MCASEGMRLVTYGRSEMDLKEEYSVCRGCCRPLSVTINKMLASEQAKIDRKEKRVLRLQKEEAVQNGERPAPPYSALRGKGQTLDSKP